jgi:predicted O-linked N-acetylglucosamine transferase (SPINDLY family)
VRILARVPGSRLVLKNKAMADPAVRAQAVDFFVARGIAAERIETLSRVPDPRGHLALYGMVDVALDPFPYNGVTTTCEALAMGVPVVALRGATPAGRTAAALVARIGCPELAVDGVDAYVDAAVALAGDRARLVSYRRTLRARLAVSPLGDGAAIAADLTHALRGLWHAWVREIPAG